MLRAKVLPDVLGQIVGDGISACMCVDQLFMNPVYLSLGDPAAAAVVTLLMPGS